MCSGCQIAMHAQKTGLSSMERLRNMIDHPCNIHPLNRRHHLQFLLKTTPLFLLLLVARRFDAALAVPGFFNFVLQFQLKVEGRCDSVDC